MKEGAPEHTSPGPRPLWIPPDVKFDQLSPELQYAITEIVNPAYNELVLGAQTALERCSGLSYVHLTWLELVEAIALGKDMGKTLTRGGGTDAQQEKLGRHLRLVAQKDKIAKFILELEKFYERAGDTDPLRRVPR